MKKTNLAKKGLMPAVLGAVCSVVALTSVSYAWFTMGDTSRVDEIEVNVQAAGGMQISANAVDWKSVLPTDELKDESLTNNEFNVSADGMKPTSSVGEYVNGKQNMFLGNIGEDGELDVTASAAGHYIAFDLYIKVDADETLVLDADSFVRGLSNVDTELAVRVSFADFGGVDGTPAAAQELGKDFNGKARVWEPNANTHAEEVYVNGTISEAQKTQVLEYDGVKGIQNTNEPVYDKLVEPSSKYIDLFTTNYTDENGKIGAGQVVELFDLSKGINKIRVYIWLEGQDVDCVNSISGAGFGVGLSFKLKE